MKAEKYIKTKEKDQHVFTSMWIDADLYKKVTSLAKAKKATLRAIMEAALRKFLDDLK